MFSIIIRKILVLSPIFFAQNARTQTQNANENFVRQSPLKVCRQKFSANILFCCFESCRVNIKILHSHWSRQFSCETQTKFSARTKSFFARFRQSAHARTKLSVAFSAKLKQGFTINTQIKDSAESIRNPITRYLLILYFSTADGPQNVGQICFWP